MEKIKAVSVPVGEKTFSLYAYGFSTEEALGIRDTLSEYDTKAVIRFLIEVEDICSKQLSIMNAAMSSADMATEKRKMLGHFDKAKNDIGQLLDNKIKLVPTEKVNKLPLENMTDVELYERYRQRLLDAFYALDEVSSFVATSISAKRQGRPPADHTLFISSIMECYRRHIDQPSTYRDGAFFETMRIILNSVDLPHEDPSRAIQAALK